MFNWVIVLAVVFVIAKLKKTMKNKILLIISILSLLNISSNAQNYDFGFIRDNSIIVNDSLGNPISMPWVGGLNAVHFSQIDLNFDNLLDLIVFDIHGDKLTTYINDGISDSSSYTYAPQYINALPIINGWIQTCDYDNDGDMDIFTYTSGSIRLCENVSSLNNLVFTAHTNVLEYRSPLNDTTNNYINIYTGSVDYPAFVDIDYDGDMDVIAFNIFGSVLVWYKNYSMELSGASGMLEFKIEDYCWGNFIESSVYNSVIMDFNCNNSNKMPMSVSASGSKHSGSTLLVTDLNNDSLFDLILGDVDYSTIIALTNGGNRDSAHMVSQDTTFPSYDAFINLISFPVVSFLDIDNDSIKEFVIGSFDATYFRPEARNSVWLYENTGTNNAPIMNYKQSNFFQDRMIDVGDDAAPTIVDVDGDGLLDIIIGNYGNIDSSYIDSAAATLRTNKIFYTYILSKCWHYISAFISAYG